MRFAGLGLDVSPASSPGREPQNVRLLPQRGDYEIYVLVQVHAELLGPAGYVLPGDVRGEGFLLHLLTDTLCLESLETFGAHQGAGRDKAGELVHGVEGPGKERLPRHAQ